MVVTAVTTMDHAHATRSVTPAAWQEPEPHSYPQGLSHGTPMTGPRIGKAEGISITKRLEQNTPLSPGEAAILKMEAGATQELRIQQEMNAMKAEGATDNEMHARWTHLHGWDNVASNNNEVMKSAHPSCRPKAYGSKLAQATG